MRPRNQEQDAHPGGEGSVSTRPTHRTACHLYGRVNNFIPFQALAHCGECDHIGGVLCSGQNGRTRKDRSRRTSLPGRRGGGTSEPTATPDPPPGDGAASPRGGQTPPPIHTRPRTHAWTACRAAGPAHHSSLPWVCARRRGALPPWPAAAAAQFVNQGSGALQCNQISGILRESNERPCSVFVIARRARDKR